MTAAADPIFLIFFLPDIISYELTKQPYLMPLSSSYPWGEGERGGNIN
jgi:hypothetical protein